MQQGIKVSLLCALLIGASCGADATATYRDYALRNAQANCERIFRCCGTQCPSTVDATFNQSIENTQYALEKGLAIFNLDKANSCLDTNNSLYTDCNQYVDLLDTSYLNEACTGVLEGTLPLGAACSIGTNDYCKPTTYCANDTSFTPPQARCRRVANVGESCAMGVRCVTGSTCDTLTTQTCVGNPPTAKFGEACSSMVACSGSLSCLPTGVCGLPLEGGQACTNNNQCLSNRCAVDVCTLSMSKPQTVADLVCP